MSMNDLMKLVNAGFSAKQIAGLMGGNGAAKPRGKGKARGGNRLTKEEFEAALVAACKGKGYPNPEPRFNILTFGKKAKDGKPATGWISKGRIVKTGEKSIRVNGEKTMLFHEAQTREMTAEERVENGLAAN